MPETGESGESHSRRFFRLFNLGWLLVSLVSLTYSALGTFTAHPQYLHEWRAPTTFALMLGILGCFSFLSFSSLARKFCHTGSLLHPLLLLYWIIPYLIVTALNLLDTHFVWSYFVVVGLTFALFTSQLVWLLVAWLFLSYCWFLGLLTWPLTADRLSAIIGICIAFTSITLLGVSIQHLANERLKRDHLLQELRQTNTELEAAQRLLAENMAQEQELAVLRERTRLAREMHDTLGHALVLISVKLEAAQRLRALDPPRCEQELEATREIVRESMKELRASIANLRSPALEHEPACRALSRYARAMAMRTGLRISYDLHPDIEGLPETVEETLWKVGQEALTNIEKHAHASTVLLHISRQDGQVVLKIADDGVGLPADLCQLAEHESTQTPAPTGHYGLSGIQERVRNARGRLVLDRSGTQGTSLEVVLPVVETPLPIF